MRMRRSVCLADHFLRAQALTTTPAGIFGWTVKDTSPAGTPTYLVVSGAGMNLTLAASSEEEIVTMYQNDVLNFVLGRIQKVRFWASVSGVDAVTSIVMGLASAQNDTEDSVTYNAWFKIDGTVSTSNVVCESDDNVNDKDDKATGVTLGSTVKEFTIDFTNGLADVHFYIDGQRVANNVTFDMSNVSSTQKVQLFFQLHKASGTGTPALKIYYVDIEYVNEQGAA